MKHGYQDGDKTVSRHLICKHSLILATGTFQRETSDRSGIYKSIVSCALAKILQGIMQVMPQFIRFPYTAAQQTQLKRIFMPLLD